MARVAKPLDAKQLDAMIAATLAKGVTHNVLRWVGGHPPGLALQITPTGSCSWIMRTTTNGRRREIGLGSYRTDGRPPVSLSKARKEAARIHDWIGEGRDPVAERRKGRERKRTFAECADAYIEANRAGWKNAKHAVQWRSTLEAWVYPKIGGEPVGSVDRGMIEALLLQPVAAAGGEALWSARHETANRVRQRIEAVLDDATVRDYRTGPNPARWLSNLKSVMPKVSKEVRRVRHHAALPWSDAPAFMAELSDRAGVAARALQFTILTAARSGEVRMADWAELDLDGALWTVPEGRMKAGIEHTVPLTDAAIAILAATPEAERKGLVFPGATIGKPMSDMTLAAVLKRMKRTDITVHGFRSTFRDWAGEESTHAREVIENALAHQLEDKAEAAYARGTQLLKRRKLMTDWEAYLLPPVADKGA